MGRYSYVLPFVSGILLALCLPWVLPVLRPLIFVALVPFLLFASARKMTPLRLVLGTLVMGVPYTLLVVFPLMRVTGWWWVSSPEILGGPLNALLIGSTVLLIGVWEALFFIPLSFVVRRFVDHPMGGIIIPSAWVIVEFLRSTYALFGSSWGVLGYTLVDMPIIQSGATLPGGVLFLSFTIILGNLAFLALWNLYSAKLQQGKNETPDQKQFSIGIGEGASIGLFFVLCSVLVVVSFFHNETTACSAPPVRVAVVASVLPTEDSVGEGAYRYYRAKLLEALALNPKVVLFPENVFPFFELDETHGGLNARSIIALPNRDLLYKDFLELSRLHPETIIFLGLHTVSEEEDAHTKRYNSLVGYENGVPTFIYHKQKLMPLGEYAPFSFVPRVFEPITSGGDTPPFVVSGVRTTALVCSEVGDLGLRDMAASLILSPSNDSVFTSTSAALMAHDMARMRALEAGAYVLRASKGGLSSIIGPDGKALVVGTNSVLSADILPGCRSRL